MREATARGAVGGQVFAEGGGRMPDVSERHELEKRPALDCSLSIPLVLDLDGTLLATDTFYEALLLFLQRRPSAALRLPFWAFRGKAHLKEKLSAIISEDDVARFPANDSLQYFAEREARLGRRVVLATAADRALAEKVKGRFSFISEIVASDGRKNLRGAAKADELRRVYPGGFIYAGDADPDIHVWRHARGAIFVGTSPRLLAKIGRVSEILATFPQEGANEPKR
jgi:hypothetical protein